MSDQNRYSIAILLQAVCPILGVDPDAALASTQWSSDERPGADLTVTGSDYISICHAIFAIAGERGDPLVLGRAMANGPVHPIFLAFAIAPNAAEGLQRMARYKTMFGPVALDLARTSRGLLLEVIADDPTLVLPDCLAASIGIFLVEKCRNHSARRIVPVDVALPPDAIGFAGVVDFLGRKPTRGAHVRFEFAAADMAAPFLSENPALWHDIRNDLEGQLAQRSGAETFADEVEVAIRRALTFGPVRVDAICHDLRISRSTMQRRLVEEGSTYQQVLDGVRQGLAIRYLTKSDIHLPEIARLVGFSDAKSFYRAFKSWTGQPPGTFREASAS